MAFTSLADIVQNFESGGNYGAVNIPLPGQAPSTASGAYGFTNPTWRQYLGQIAGTLGISPSLYPTARSAPASVQDAVFNQAVTVNGLNDWTCPRCDPALVNYLTANPSSMALPISPGNPATAPASATGGTTTTGQAGATQNAQSNCGNLWNPLNWGCAVVGSFVGRFLYGVVGLVLIAMAIFIYAMRTRDQG